MKNPERIIKTLSSVLACQSLFFVELMGNFRIRLALRKSALATDLLSGGGDKLMNEVNI